MQLLTLSYPIREHAICLGYKSRGLGKGYWNGFGGKVCPGETTEEAAIRELREETTIKTDVRDLERVALITFLFEDGRRLEVHTFFVTQWEGVIAETEEMRTPTWYSFDTIPYEQMWADDIHWLPRALAGERVRGWVSFDATEAHIKEMEWKTVNSFDDLY